MELLTWSLLCALFASAYAGPAGLRLHQDADIQDSDLTSDLDLDRNELQMRSHYTDLRFSSESQSSEESSHESSEESREDSSEESLKESSEELASTPAPSTNTPPASSVAPTGVPIAMSSPGTGLPTVDNSTVPEPCPTSGCVTIDIPTSPPVTGSRGDS